MIWWGNLSAGDQIVSRRKTYGSKRTIKMMKLTLNTINYIIQGGPHKNSPALIKVSFQDYGETTPRRASRSLLILLHIKSYRPSVCLTMSEAVVQTLARFLFANYSL